MAERLKLWFIQRRTGVFTGGSQGLPQAGPAPLVHIEDAAGTLAFTQAYSCHAQGAQVHWEHTYMQYKHIRYSYTKDRLHPEMKKHLGLQDASGGPVPSMNLEKYNQHCT